jgi:hypothetical protein
LSVLLLLLLSLLPLLVLAPKALQHPFAALCQLPSRRTAWCSPAHRKFHLERADRM